MKKPRIELKDVVKVLKDLKATTITAQIPEYMLCREIFLADKEEWILYGVTNLEAMDRYTATVLHKFCQKPRKYPIRRKQSEGIYYYWLEEKK